MVLVLENRSFGPPSRQTCLAAGLEPRGTRRNAKLWRIFVFRRSHLRCCAAGAASFEQHAGLRGRHSVSSKETHEDTEREPLFKMKPSTRCVHGLCMCPNAASLRPSLVPLSKTPEQLARAFWRRQTYRLNWRQYFMPTTNHLR